jgi:hypothetical protein
MMLPGLYGDNFVKKIPAMRGNKKNKEGGREAGFSGFLKPDVYIRPDNKTVERQKIGENTYNQRPRFRRRKEIQLS